MTPAPALPAALFEQGRYYHLTPGPYALSDKAVGQVLDLAHTKLLAGQVLTDQEQVLLARAARELQAYRQRTLAQNRGHRKPRRR